MKRLCHLILALLALGPAAEAQQLTSPSTGRWLLLCSGLPGDDEHRERLTRACQQIIASSESILSVSPERLRVLAGDEEMRAALAEHAPGVEVCTQQSVAQALQHLGEEVAAEDACWVMLLGHASLYDRSSRFNVQDSDFDQKQFAAWAKSFSCQEQVFWVTMPVSGFWIKPLSGRSRVVISSTEADLESTGTEMPYALADILAGEAEEQSLEDLDQDGTLSLLDLYLAVNLEITGRFRSTEHLQTEHARLDDNGDGRGSEVQEPYLPVQEVETEEDEEVDAEPSDPSAADETQRPKVITQSSLDGYRSRQILINSPQAENENSGS